jgi:uncharacterized protein (TIGR02466 family)
MIWEKIMDNLNIHIFGVPIQQYNLNLDISTLIAYFYQLKKNDKGRKLSNEGGWQSNDLNLENNNQLTPFLKSLKEPILNFSKYCKIKNNFNFKVDNMWCNINQYKDYNIYHNHPGCLFSGVYYLKTPKNCGDLYFSNTSIQIPYDWKESVIEEFNCFNSSKWNFPVKENILFLFPSWAHHAVHPNLNKKEDRISISFNINYDLN